MCNIYIINELENIHKTYSLVAYVEKCGATLQNSVHLSWKNHDEELASSGNIFSAINGNHIQIKMIAPDTVKVFYFARDVKKKIESDKHIHFIYEVKPLSFFNEDNNDISP
jgi:hypothetical protein